MNGMYVIHEYTCREILTAARKKIIMNNVYRIRIFILSQSYAYSTISFFFSSLLKAFAVRLLYQQFDLRCCCCCCCCYWQNTVQHKPSLTWYVFTCLKHKTLHDSSLSLFSLSLLAWHDMVWHGLAWLGLFYMFMLLDMINPNLMLVLSRLFLSLNVIVVLAWFMYWNDNNSQAMWAGTWGKHIYVLPHEWFVVNWLNLFVSIYIHKVKYTVNEWW